MDSLVKNLHVFIILYACFNLYTIYEEQTVNVEMLQNEVPSLQAQIQQSKNKIAEIETFKENLEASKERVKEVVKQIEKVQKQLPTDVNDTLVQQYFTNTAQKLRMLNPNPTTQDEKLNGFYYSKNYKFTASGTFLQTLILLEQITKSERILNVKSLDMKQTSLKRRSRFQILDIEMAIESYRYNTNYQEKSGVEEIEQQFKVN